MVRKVILDCDPGHDDAIAILLASLSENINLLGISVSCGNQTVDKTANNALNLVEFLNLDIPVSIGSSVPLVKEALTCGIIHGESGLDGYDFLPHSKSFDKRNGAELIIDLCKQNKNVTVIVTGPLTNFALALRMHPEIKENIKEVIVMGGSMGLGNMTPAAEFNILVDPEAAHIVFTSGLKIKMVGLDVTRKVLVTDKIIKRMERLHTKSSDLFVSLMKFFVKTQKEVFHFAGAPLHDPATMMPLIDSSIIKFKKMHVEVDLSHLSSYGRTNCDIDDILKNNKNIEVAIAINVEAYFDIIENILKKY